MLIAQGIAPERAAEQEQIFYIFSVRHLKFPETFQKGFFSLGGQGLRATRLHHPQSRVRHERNQTREKVGVMYGLHHPQSRVRHERREAAICTDDAVTAAPPTKPRAA